MKKKELGDLREKGKVDLEKLIMEKKVKLEEFISKEKPGSKKDLKVGKKIRREIAQILTIMKEKELQKKESLE